MGLESIIFAKIALYLQMGSIMFCKRLYYTCKDSIIFAKIVLYLHRECYNYKDSMIIGKTVSYFSKDGIIVADVILRFPLFAYHIPACKIE